jgi:DNA-binding SARP family transcriptional activator/tetratricopeptide (TPR) repeat protein
MRQERDIQVRLLGDLQVVGADGRAIKLPASKKTRALLGYLVATGQPHRRERLCDLFWDGPADPRAELRWSLNKLRPVLNGDRIIRLRADREWVAFEPIRARIDLAIVRQQFGSGVASVATDTLETTLHWFRGVFLDGLDLLACYQYQEWCMAEREAASRLHLTVLRALISKLAERPLDALPYARALVAADPLDEVAHAQLIRLLRAMGRRREAEEHGERARAMLVREVGSPLAGELDRALSSPAGRAGDASPSSDSRTAESPIAIVSAASGSRLPLVGRASECKALDRSIDRLMHEQPQRMWLLIGDVGIGKTRLLEYFVDGARAKGCLVLSARGFEAEMLRPYGCWIDALRVVAPAAVPTAIRKDLAFLMRGLGMDPPEASDRSQLFEAVRALLQSLAHRQPLVLAFDDVQWLDESSVALVHYVVRKQGDHSRWLFAAAARRGEIEDNRWAKQLVNTLERNQQLSSLPLQPLSAGEIARLLRSFGPDVDAAAAFNASAGNPLLALEIARAGETDAHLTTLDVLVASELARLPEATRQFLMCAAAVGREFQPELVGAAIDMPSTELLSHLARLELRGLLRPSNTGYYDFCHDVIRQTTYRGLSQPRRQLLHRQLARVLAVAAAEDDTLQGDLAHHAQLGDADELSVRASIATGDRALRLSANAEALAAASRGLASLARLPSSTARIRQQMELLRIQVLAVSSPGMRRAPALREDLMRAIREAEAAGLHAEAAAGYFLLSWVEQRSNDTSRVREATLLAAQLSRAADEITHLQQVANTARCLMDVEADIGRARELMREAELLAARTPTPTIELEWVRALFCRWDGNLETALERIVAALDLARIRQDRWREFQCLTWRAGMELELRRFDDVVRSSEELERVARPMGDTNVPIARALGALARLAMGDDRPTVAEFEDAVQELRSIDDKAHLAYVLNRRALTLLDAGEFPAAGACSADALAVATAIGRSAEIAIASATLSRVAMARGDADAARQHLEPFAPGRLEPALLSAQAIRELAGAVRLAGAPDSNDHSNGATIS